MNVMAIAIFFLASITGVYGTFFICNTVLSSEEVGHSHDANHHVEVAEGTHSHNSDSSTDDCCDDLTLSFLNGAKVLANQLHVEFPSIGEIIILQPVTFKLVGFENFGSPSHVIDPPPKAVHRRILYQSFII
ncbi:hypothetical protein LV84_03727 [Algoriphagus ratkowskyi]|uniref:Uncharacterized protein n=2 Tax=Algoriphagus ratkowskyi TaxID=57028 RepID=A0A2W7R003_9BACT|nr:hypothetical protein LV84_03727 [Algoriphagus ratkowskyi]